MYWIAFGLAGGSLILSAATLYVVLGVRRSTRRTNERATNAWRSCASSKSVWSSCTKSVACWRRSWSRAARIWTARSPLLALEAASGSNGYPVHEQPKARSWLRRSIGRIGSTTMLAGT